MRSPNLKDSGVSAMDISGGDGSVCRVTSSSYVPYNTKRVAPGGQVEVHSVETPCLGNRSYVVVDGSSAIVVDPPRDIDRIEAVLDECDARVDLVLETHRHADYVSGGLHLSRRHRADYVVPPGEPEPRHGFTAALEGRTFGTGAIGVRVLATPGHTPHHVAYLVEHEENPVAVCTGGSLLHGSV